MRSMYLAFAIILGAITPHVMASSALDSPRNAHLKSLVQSYMTGKTVCPIVIMAPGPVTVFRKNHAVPEKAWCPSSSAQAPSFAVIEREARRIGVDPVVMWAIEVHETGDYTSPKWRRWRNPGGLEYREFDGIRCVRHGRWAGFMTEEDGIRAHAIVLAHSRYDGARRTNDPLEQVEAIGRGGYCEPGYNWAGQVKRWVRRLMSRRPKATTAD